MNIRQSVTEDNTFSTQIVGMCNTHNKKKVVCYGCEKDPLSAEQPAEVVWISCDFCNVWYHDICVKKSIFESQ